MVSAYDNVPLWHERDISHSSVERIILPDATILLNYMLNRFARIVEQLTVFEDNMRRNMERSYGLIYSQRVLLTLINKGLKREEAYDLVQANAMKAWQTAQPFKTLLEKEETIQKLLAPGELDELFDPSYHTKHVDLLFKRVGLE
jgi:adenylosuccinate lyase